MKVAIFRARRRALSTAVAVVCGAFAVPSNAIIPVTDYAHILQDQFNFVESIAQWMEQVAYLEDQYNQAKDQFDETKNLITGNANYGAYFNLPELTDYLPKSTTAGGWEQIYSAMNSGTLNSYRSKYHMTSSNTVQQKANDQKLANLRAMEEAYAAHNKRLDNVQNLQSLADSAATPQEKQDIQSRLLVEQASIATDGNRLAATRELMDRNDKLMAQEQNRAYAAFLNGE